MAERQAGEMNRLSDLADVMRRQSAKRARMAKSIDKRVARLASSACPRRRRNATPGKTD